MSVYIYIYQTIKIKERGKKHKNRRKKIMKIKEMGGY